MNPEFQRHLWLDASPRRAIWAGVTVLLVYFAVALLSRDLIVPGGTPRAAADWSSE